MKKILLVLLLSLAVPLSGCSKAPSFDEIGKTNDALTADIKSELGHEALLGYMQDGSHVTVTVILVGVDQAKADQAKPKLEAIVRRHWPKVNEIVVESQPE